MLDVQNKAMSDVVFNTRQVSKGRHWAPLERLGVGIDTGLVGS